MANYVDAFAILVIAFYLIRGIYSGLWTWIIGLVSLIASLYTALFFYAPIGAYLQAHVPALIASTASLTTPAWDTVGFILVMAIVQIVLSTFFFFLRKKFPQVFVENKITHALALIPALIEGIIAVVLLVVVSTVLPIPTQYTTMIQDSYTGKLVARELPAMDTFLNHLTGDRLDQALSLLTTHNEDDEHAEALPFKPSHTTVDEAGEVQMLALVNAERAAAGVGPLTIDPALTTIARAHSQDMFDRQYFSHVNPDGQDPFARMAAAGITYTTAGENIALAATVELANTGLMNSPGHRANILNPAFHRIGIGIIDGGIYGKMVTQDFTN